MSEKGKWMNERDKMVHKQRNAMNELTKNHDEETQEEILQGIAARADGIQHLNEKIDGIKSKE